jgi:hypothetical protein
MTDKSDNKVVGITNTSVSIVRVFDVKTNTEVSKDWDTNSLLKFSSQIRLNPLLDNQIIFYCSYQRIHRVIKNFDRNEVFIYWEHLVGYDPISEFNKKQLI